MTQSDNKSNECCKSHMWTHIYWWSFLLVAVLAVPSIAFVVAALVPGQGITQILVFIVSCWVSTFIGMKLMKMTK
jgi:hypothetical protein